MCDCYYHKCSVCDDTIPVHIGDYKYPRTDVEAWCFRHIPKNEPGVEVFVMAKASWDEGRIPRGRRYALRLCGGTIVPSSVNVEINLSGAEPEKQKKRKGRMA